VLRERTLRGERCFDGGARVVERGEELVGAAVDLLAAGRLDRLALDPPRLAEDVGIPVSEIADETCRVLQVGEEERPARWARSPCARV